MAEQSKTSRQGLASRELLGMVLFTLSAFPLVLVGYALAHDGEDAVGGTAAIARAIVDAVGYLPAMICAGGFALVGGAMALAARDVDVGRHLSGFLFAAIGLAVCLGALRESGQGLLHGGVLGDATGGALRGIGAWAGVVIGGAVAFAAAWLAWLGGSLEWPPAGRFRRNGGQTPTISDALSERDSDGVSPAEASALVPDQATLSYMEELWQADTSPAQPTPIPPSPYPEDVRLKGEIPEGAAPLTFDDDPNDPRGAAEAGTPSWRPAEAERRPADAPGHDLAGQGQSASTVEVQAGPVPRIDRAGQELGVTTAGAVTPLDAATPLREQPDPAERPVRASWEQPDLFGGEQTADVDGSELEDLEEDEVDPEAEVELDDELEEEEQGDEDEDEEDDLAAELEEDDDEEEYEEDDEAEAELDDEEDEEFEDEQEAAELDEELEQAQPEREDSEPEVVLQPAVAPESPAPAAADVPREQLLHEAGRLFLEHGRVAVSLLQRCFGIDFDDACEVLDELQDLGLIGPYMGGQKRDILMSLDEWEGRLAGS